jgi:hypothetical protein
MGHSQVVQNKGSVLGLADLKAFVVEPKHLKQVIVGSTKVVGGGKVELKVG